MAESRVRLDPSFFSMLLRRLGWTDVVGFSGTKSSSVFKPIARFIQGLALVLLGVLQEIQVRLLHTLTQEESTSQSPHPGNRTLGQENADGQGRVSKKGKGKNKKKDSATGHPTSQKDYKRPTTFKEFYEHCKNLRPFIWPANSRKLQIHILLCLALLAAGRVVNVLVPQQVANVVNALTMVENERPGGMDENGDRRFIWKEIMVFIALRALQGSIGAVDTLQTILWIPVGQFNTRELAVKMFEHLLNLSLRFHLNRKTGEMLRVQDRGVTSIVTLLSSLLFNILPCLIDIAVACVIMTRSFDIYFGIIVAVTMICYIYVTILLTDWRTRYRRESNALDNAVEARAVDALLNYETIKIFATEEYEVQKYTEAIHEYQKADRKSQYTLGILNLILNVVIQGGLALGCLLCAKRVVTREMSAGDFVMYYSYILQLYSPLTQFGTSYRSLQKNFIDMEKMLDLFKEPAEIQDPPEPKPLVMTGGEVVFENVSFGYNPQNPNLKSVSFKIPQGKKLALVGPSGGGKSTILRLLFRFYDPTQGRILIDGQDIRHVTQSSLRRKIGIVPQDTTLFNETIEYNIGYGKIGQENAQIFDPSRVSSSLTTTTTTTTTTTAPLTPRQRCTSGASSDEEDDGSGTADNVAGEGGRRPSSSSRSSKSSARGRRKNGQSSNTSGQGQPQEIEGGADADGEHEEGVWCVDDDDDDEEDWQDDPRIQAAAEAARIHEIITRFPDEYATRVGERGMRLSGGEKQRVAIARTILKNPPILLLDEATSALDTQTEREIQNSIEAISKDRTTLMIAHRLSTIIDADEILVIQRGEIAEQGSHEDLMQAGGIYAAMWMQQLREDRIPMSSRSSNNGHGSTTNLSSHKGSSSSSTKAGDEEDEEADSSDDASGRYWTHRNHSGRYPNCHLGVGHHHWQTMAYSLPTYPTGSGSNWNGILQNRTDTTGLNDQQLSIMPGSDTIHQESSEEEDEGSDFAPGNRE
ncbi:hypothetical protein B0O80DRAFT_497478 [Mortierella sp. GBAus27b]|nr:hypothetical protein B0O80DRAFT_497478 [Mortierella sp. GBAus27b]